MIALLEKVTREDIQQIAQEFFQPERLAASVVGNLDGFELTRDQLSFLKRPLNLCLTGPLTDSHHSLLT